MRKLLYTCCVLVVWLVTIHNLAAQYVTIPDANFYSCLQNQFPSCVNYPNQLNTACSEVVNATSLEVYSFTGTIKDLTGIQYFTNLKYLNCSGAAITTF